VVSALLIKGGTLTLAPLLGLLPVALAMVAGAVSAASAGVALVHRTSEHLLERFILVLLVGIGTTLVVEAFLPHEVPGFLLGGSALLLRLVVAFLFGLFIGLVSSLLGVAGGELIIPTLVFVFGAGIKTAGTASLLISLPTVAVGVLRHASLGSFCDRRDMRATVAPMGVRSVIGAVVGGLLVGLVRAATLKLVLGIILVVSAVRISAHTSATSEDFPSAYFRPRPSRTTIRLSVFEGFRSPSSLHVSASLCHMSLSVTAST